MDVSFQPKSAMPNAQTGPSSKDILVGIGRLYVGEKRSLVTILLTLVFFIVLALFIFLFIATGSLKAQVNEKAGELNQKDSLVISPSKLSDITKLSNRVAAVSAVVKGQPFMTTFLKLLEYSVEDDVVFKKAVISPTHTPNGAEIYAFSLDVEANSYSAVLDQMETLQQEKPYSDFFSNVTMSSFGVNKDGGISFKINGNVSIQGMSPDDAEKELLQVLSPQDLPSAAQVQSGTSPLSASSTSQ